MFGQLHRSGADTARSTFDEHLFPALKFCPPEKIQRCLAAKRQRGGFVVKQAGRLERYRAIFWPAFVLGMSPHRKTAHGKNRVANFEFADAFADRFNVASEFTSKHGLAGLGDAKYQTRDQPESARYCETAQSAIRRRDRCRPNSDQHLVVLRRRFDYLLQSKNFWRPVAFINDGSHAFSNSTVGLMIKH